MCYEKKVFKLVFEFLKEVGTGMCLWLLRQETANMTRDLLVFISIPCMLSSVLKSILHGPNASGDKPER